MHLKFEKKITAQKLGTQISTQKMKIMAFVGMEPKAKLA
jgi:hypothetical protein